MAQGVKCLLYKHKDANLDPQHACTKTGMPVIPVLGVGMGEGDRDRRIPEAYCPASLAK